MNKTNKILMAVLAGQVVLALITWMAVKDSPEVTAKSKLFPFETADVSKMEVVATQGDEITPAVVLEKKGDNWVLASADEYPVETTKVTEILEQLVVIETEKPIATTKANHSKLNVAQEGFDRKITLTANGKSVTAYLGRGTRSGSHVRLQGSEEVFDVAGFSVWSVQSRASNYVNTEYVKVDADKTKSITVTNPKGSLQFVKEGENWTIPGLLPEEATDTDAAPAVADGDTDSELKKEIDAAEIKRIADKLMSVSVVEPVGKKDDAKFGLKDGTKVVINTEKDGKPQQVEFVIGAKDESNRYVKAKDSDYIVKVSNHSVEPATEKVAADFIKEVKPGEKTAAPQMPPGMQGMPPGMQGMPPGMQGMPPGMAPQ